MTSVFNVPSRSPFRNVTPVAINQYKPAVGDIKMSVAANDHAGWLLCDGRSFQAAEYAELFDLVGQTFGGAPGQFSIPDARGRVAAAVGGAHPPGQAVGEETHTLTVNEMPAHNHDGSTGASKANVMIGNSGTHSHILNSTNVGNSMVIKTVGTGGEIAETMYEKSDAETHTHIVEEAGDHTHTVNEAEHIHIIRSNGGNMPHNNMQPTLFIGNYFIYSGKN